MSEMGPVIGAHAGPGVIGVTAMRDALLGPV
jgi:fatty acid-binding protein DegV